jgi:hypothetical protein
MYSNRKRDQENGKQLLHEKRIEKCEKYWRVKLNSIKGKMRF